MLYYLPAVHQVTRERIEAAGLGYAFEARPVSVPVVRGPLEGSGGVILCDPKAPHAERLGYYCDEQTWRKVPGAKSHTEHGHVCVGMWNDARPNVETLARQSLLPGTQLELADGRTWLAPRAIQWADSEPPYPIQTLPRSLGVSDDGEWVQGEILPRFARLWEIAEAWHALLAARVDPEGGVAVEIEVNDLYDWAAECLTANYRIGKAEIDMLGLFTHAHAQRILSCLLDESGLAAILQKKTAY